LTLVGIVLSAVFFVAAILGWRGILLWRREERGLLWERVAFLIVLLAVVIAERNYRPHLANEWLDHRISEPQIDPASPPLKSGQVGIALQFLIGSLRMRSYDICQRIWHPINLGLISDKRINVAISCAQGILVIFLASGEILKSTSSLPIWLRSFSLVQVNTRSPAGCARFEA
jgi:hypothetical protein